MVVRMIKKSVDPQPYLAFVSDTFNYLWLFTIMILELKKKSALYKLSNSRGFILSALCIM